MCKNQCFGSENPNSWNEWVNMGSIDKVHLFQCVLHSAHSTFQLEAMQSGSEWAKKPVSFAFLIFVPASQCAYAKMSTPCLCLDGLV